MNNNVVTINRGPLSDYVDSQKTNRSLDRVIFFGGIILTMILPKLIYVVSGGPISLSAFSVLASAGVIMGVGSYLYPAPGPLLIVGPGSRNQSPDRLEPSNRKAA
jgi:hypothetical protein